MAKSETTMKYIFVLILAYYLPFAYCEKDTCKAGGGDFMTCRCYRLPDSKVFVNCSNSNLSIRDACTICRRIADAKELDLSRNNLTDIPELCFADCQNVTMLSLMGNRIQMLPKKVFKYIPRLQILNLDNNLLINGNNISTPEAFESLIHLRLLRLKGNAYVNKGDSKHKYLSNVSKRAFGELQKLFLDGLPYGSFGENFLNFQSLAYLDLSGTIGNCRILGLTNNTFKNVPYLTHLILSKCQISTIDAGAFESLSRLKNLNLSYNMELGFVTLRNVSYGLQNTSIEILDYSKVYKTFGTTNQLKRCHLWYLNNTNLKELRLNSNRMSGIEVDGVHLVPRSLEVFWAEDNNWEYGPFILQSGCISNLTILEVSGKIFGHDLDDYNKELHIKEKENNDYGPDACKVPKSAKLPNCPFLEKQKLHPLKLTSPLSLKNITMQRSNLYFKLPDYSDHVRIRNNIEYVDVSGNILYHWGGKFLLFDKLKYADLSNNFCFNISPLFFTNSPNLETLDISKNGLGRILKTDTEGLIFKPLTKLEKLNLANNDVESLPRKIFAYLKNLKILIISFNRIQKVDFDLSQMRQLSVLDMQQNKIFALPLKLLEQMESYSKRESVNISIDMSKNTIHLSCKHLKFVTWLSEHTKYFKNIQTYQFKTKADTINSFTEFRPALEDLKKNCQSYTPIIILSVVLITAFVGVIIGGLIYRFRWRLRYFYYMTKAKYTGYLPIQDSESHTFQYDAFISYANEDYKFVRNEMIGSLEDDDGLTLCIHERDFTPGMYIAENILRAIKNSRSTIILLSESFLQSKWCIYEFNMAWMEGIYSRGGENILIVIMYEEVDMAHLSPEMVQCLGTETFIKYEADVSETSYFWQTLKQALIVRRNK